MKAYAVVDKLLEGEHPKELLAQMFNPAVFLERNGFSAVPGDLYVLERRLNARSDWRTARLVVRYLEYYRVFVFSFILMPCGEATGWGIGRSLSVAALATQKAAQEAKELLQQLVYMVDARESFKVDSEMRRLAKASTVKFAILSDYDAQVTPNKAVGEIIKDLT